MTVEHSDKPPIAWGILGCARIARSGLIPGIVGSHRGELRALASRDGSTARAWANEFGIPKAYEGYEALLADPDIRAVYIPLPNELHLPWVERAAEAGKHVLCEKPLARDAEEARRMVEFCRERGVLLVEAFMWRHQPRVAELLRLTRRGVIGELRLIRSAFSFPIDTGDWRLEADRGGGALWDVGCYGVNTARLFAGAEPIAVQAMMRPWSTGVDMSLVANLEFPSGLLATIDCSFEQPFRCEYELVGSKGAILAPGAYLSAGRDVAELRGPDEGEPIRELVFDNRNQYAAMVDSFNRAIDEGSIEPPDPSENGLAQMRALDAVLASARRGEKIRLDGN